MTIETTLAPPKEKPWHKCSDSFCKRLWRAFHGKVGCKCHECDDVTPERFRDVNDLSTKLEGE